MTPNKTLCFTTFAFKHCIQVTNVFTTGCDMFKKEAVTKHEKRTGIDILFQWNTNEMQIHLQFYSQTFGEFFFYLFKKNIF